MFRVHCKEFVQAAAEGGKVGVEVAIEDRAVDRVEDLVEGRVENRVEAVLEADLKDDLEASVEVPPVETDGSPAGHQPGLGNQHQIKSNHLNLIPKLSTDKSKIFTAISFK